MASAPVALVTGAAGTIGSAVCHALAARGFALALTDADASALADLAAELGLQSVEVRSEAVDLRDGAAVERFLESVLAGMGRVDACVLAAGVAGPVGPAEHATDADLELVFDVNVHAMFRVLRGVLPAMRRSGGGRIVTIASGAGLNGAAYIAPYAASKHAVVGLTRSLALEQARANIAVNAVCPGLVESPMLRAIDEQIASITGERTDPSGAASVPIGRHAEPNEIAELVAYLAAEAPIYMTGAALSIDGGLRV
jgi:NAD(P)-dependent dehydrogenase (short-subunit alcohol dehydrogenase family)